MASGHTASSESSAEITRLHQRIADLESELATAQQILHTAPVFLYVYDIQEQRSIFNTSAMAMLLGYADNTSMQQAGADIISRLMHPDDKARFAVHLGKLVESPDTTPIAFDYRMEHVDGSWRWFRSRDRVLQRTADGSPKQIIGTAEDITDHRQSTLDLDYIFDTSPELMCIGRFDGFFQRLNPSWTRELGWTLAELMAVPFLDFVHPDDHQLTIGALQDVTAGQAIISFVNRYRTKDGSYRWLEWVSRAVTEEKTIYAVARDITERKRIQADLEASQKFLRLIIDHIPQAIFWKARDLTYLGCNRYFAEAAGLDSPDDIVGKDDFAMPWIDVATAYQADDQAVIESNVSRIAFEEPIVDAEGATRWVRTSKIPLHTRDGEVFAVLGMFEDITERKRQEEQLRHSEARQQALLAAMPDMIFVVRGDGTYLEYWGAPEQSLIPPEQFIGKRIADIIPPELAHQHEETIARALRTQETQIMEYTVPNSDGFRFYEARISPIDDDTALAVVRDITERKQAENDLLLRDFILDHASDIVQWVDPSGHFVYVNNTMCEILSYTREELIGKPLSLIDPMISMDEWPERWDYIKQQGRVMMEAIQQSKDGTRVPVEVSAVYMRIQDNEFAIGFVRDITERKKAEAERAALQQQVIEAQRHALHELSTPLIPVADDVVIMPLIGAIDSQRAQQVMETLLAGVAEHRAQLAILDITGVAVVDTQVAQAFIQAAQAVRLLGARVMITGIQPSIAQTLVQLGVDLTGITTRNSLQDGIAAALQQH